MPRAQDATLWTPELKRKNEAAEGPAVWTRAERRDGSRPSGPVEPEPQGVIFQESFGDQPDWHSGLPQNDHGSPAGLPDRVQTAGTHIVPNGWFSVRQDPEWAPSVGHPDRHEAIEILAANADKARSGGKSYVSWRDSKTNPEFVNRFNSDSILAYRIEQGVSQIYVEFWIAFDPLWSPSGGSKLFRVSSWDQVGDIFGYGGGRNNGPVFFWDFLDFGTDVRNFCAFRGGKHGENYGLTQDRPEGFPRSAIPGSGGDFSFNWTSNVIGTLPDKSTESGTISKQFGVDVGQHQIYGAGGEYNKMAFFLKINSAPGVADGVFKMWKEDQPVIASEAVMWVPEMDVVGEMPRWNIVALGGNDNFKEYPNEDRREEWYSIDDLVIRHDIPENLT